MNDISQTHVWEKVEITFTAERSYENPYTEVRIWLDLQGPDFSKRCYGFWDGEGTFRIRVTAMKPGVWNWKSGSNKMDEGLNNLKGSFTAIEWTDGEKHMNPCRRGFIRATPNGHAFQYEDGEPFFLLGDTWWPTGTFRYRWYDDDTPRPLGSEMGFKDAVRHRKQQGFNSIAMIAAFPAWANDGLEPRLEDDKGMSLRAAWPQAGTNSAKDMHDEDGNRPFVFPGKVPGFENVFPDVDRINPAYFQNMDKKIDCLNAQGFVPFIEAARRDVGPAWKKYYDWPDSYVRYVQYVRSRYQANNCLFSPIHFDTPGRSIPPESWNETANMVIDKYGPPPFGILSGCNSSGTSLQNFGHVDKARWLTFHQLGNKRTHNYYALLTDAFYATPPVPCLNGEPYYDGHLKEPTAPAGSEVSTRWCRSGMYGSVLSGGLAGHIHGALGLWSGDVEDAAETKIWDALQFDAADQMQHLRTFVMSEGTQYRDLIPEVECVQPHRSGELEGYEGWAYCAHTQERDLFLLYFEKGCPRAHIEGAIPQELYNAQWFNPRTGTWITADSVNLLSNDEGRIKLPGFLSEKGDSSGNRPNTAPTDWGLKLTLEKK